MRKSSILLVVAAGLPLLAAAGPQRSPQDVLQELKERARTAKPEEATLANIRVARQAVEVADQYFTAGDVDKAQATVADAVHYTQLAEAALDKHSKHLKKAEITLREAERRLEEIRRTLAFDDQGPVQKAEDDMEKVHRDLLSKMFEYEK